MNVNGISIRQNEEVSIQNLAAQRELYSEVKILNGIDALISLFIPLLLSWLVAQQKDTECEMTEYLLCIFRILSLFMPIIIEWLISKKQTLAAQIQQKFDTYVYQMPWDVRLFGEYNDLHFDVRKIANKVLKQSKKRQRLENWYSVPENFDLEKGILMCQIENCDWNSRLIKRYMCGMIILGIILFILCVWLGLKMCNKEKAMLVLLQIIISVFPLFRWLIETVQHLMADLNAIGYISRHILCPNTKTDMYELQWNQKYIFDYRKSCYRIPDFLYKLFRRKDERRARHAI